LYEDSVQNERGEAGFLNRIHVLHDVSIFVPIFNDGSLLMIRKYYHGANTTLLGLPGGLINENEYPSEAAKRKLWEKTGFDSNTIEYKGWFYTWPQGFCREFTFT
jgi:8-oxo-dGTP pyrophosphatase MutT (NUDIX family)